MFEVIEIGDVVTSKGGWFSQPAASRPVKLRVVVKASCEKMGRTFEGHGKYSTQIYRADFTEGEVLTIWFSTGMLLSIGDRMSAETLAGQGYLDKYFRLAGTN